MHSYTIAAKRHRSPAPPQHDALDLPPLAVRYFYVLDSWVYSLRCLSQESAIEIPYLRQ